MVVACKAGHPLIQVMRGVGLEVREARIGGKLDLTASVRLARLARAMGAEVIHTQLSTAALWGSVAGRLAGVPVVAHVRDLIDRARSLDPSARRSTAKIRAARVSSG